MSQLLFTGGIVSLKNAWYYDLAVDGTLSFVSEHELGSPALTITASAMSLDGTDVYVAMGVAGSARVYKYNAALDTLDTGWASSGVYTPGSSILDLAVDASGNVAIISGGIKLLDSDGALAWSQGSYGSGYKVEFAPSGEILATFAAGTSTHGRRLALADGSSVTTYGTSGSSVFNGVGGLTPEDDDEAFLYISASGSTQQMAIAKVPNNGVGTTWRAGNFSSAAQTNLLVYSSGRLYSSGNDNMGFGIGNVTEWNVANGAILNAFLCGGFGAGMIEDPSTGYIIVTGTIGVDDDAVSGNVRVFTTGLVTKDVITIGTSISQIVTPAVTAPSITSEPIGEVIAYGGALSLVVVATGTATLTYQWKLGGVNISGATSATYAVGSVVGSNAGIYTCVVTNDQGTATTSNIEIAVLSTVTSQSGNTEGRVGNNATIQVIGDGGPSLGYQWRLDGVPLAGQVATDYVMSPIVLADSGTYINTVSISPSTTPIQWDSYAVNDGVESVSSTAWSGQLFLAATDLIVTSIRLKLGRDSSGDVDDIIVSIQGIDGSEKPDGTDLGSGTIAMSTLDVATESIESITMDTPFAINAGTKYNIVVKKDANSGGRLAVDTAGGYASILWDSSNSGSSWVDGGESAWFEIWGYLDGSPDVDSAPIIMVALVALSNTRQVMFDLSLDLSRESS